MTEKNETGYSKQVVMLLLGVLITAVGTIWAITWGTTSASVKDLNCRQSSSERTISAMDTRLGGMDQNITEMKSDIKELLRNQRK